MTGPNTISAPSQTGAVTPGGSKTEIKGPFMSAIAQAKNVRPFPQPSNAAHSIASINNQARR